MGTVVRPLTTDEAQLFAALHTTMTDDGMMYRRDVSRDRIVVVEQLLFGARICIGPNNIPAYDDCWDYEAASYAIDAVEDWDPDLQTEPENWIRHFKSGRRRPNGDREQEYIPH